MFKSTILKQRTDSNFYETVKQTLSSFKCKVEQVSPRVVKVSPEQHSDFHSVIGALKVISKSIEVFNDHLVVKQ